MSKIRRYISRYPAIAAVAVLSVLLGGCVRQTPKKLFDRSHNLVSRAVTSYNEGDETGSLRLIQQFVEFEAEYPEYVLTADQVRAYSMLGDIYTLFEDYPHASGFYVKALRYSENMDSTDGIPLLLHRLVVSHTQAGQTDSARIYQRRVAGLPPSDLSRYLFTLGEAYIRKHEGDTIKALMLMKESAACVDTTSLPAVFSLSPVSEIVHHYNSAGMPDSAAAYIARYDELTSLYPSPESRSDCLREYMTLYNSLGMTERSLECQREYFRITDRRYERFLSLKEEFINGRRKHLNTRMASMQLSLTFWQALSVAIILSLVILFVVIYSRRRLRRINAHLYARDKELAMLETASCAGISGTDGGDAEGEEDWQRLFERITVVTALSENFCNPNFSLTGLAHAVDANPKYVSQAIKNATGKNFRSYLNEYRIREARVRLRDTDRYGHLTLQSIAESVGFSTQSAFIRAFKAFTGITPSMFVKIAKEEDKLK